MTQNLSNGLHRETAAPTPLKISAPIEARHPQIGVPPLAGVCTYAEAARPGYGVEENVARLKRLNWVEQRLCDIVLARLNATPEWEVKGGLANHIYLDSEHAKWLQNRVAELRHPPHNFHSAPDEALDNFCEEALRCEDTVETLTAIYRVIRPALLAAYQYHFDTTNPLVDQPSRRWIRFIILEEQEQIAWGEAALKALIQDDAAREKAAAWQAHLEAYLKAARGILGDGLEYSGVLPTSRQTSKLDPDFTPQRDVRLESHNYSFPPHWVYAQRERPVDERTLALVCKRLLEMDVPEMMASIIWRAREEAAQNGKPKSWEYTADMARQMWDEARHSMMGESWLVAHGIDWTKVPLNVGFSEVLNSMATAKESHATLYAIEQGLMPQNSGKAYEWRVARDSGDAQAQLFMDYDWADEVLHVHIGRHLIEQYANRKEAEDEGNAAFSRIMQVRREGGFAQNQREWWSEFVEQVLGYTPQPLEEEVVATKDAPWKNG
jgi:hypothetical protein